MVEEERARGAVWPPPRPDSRKMRRGEHQKNGKFLKRGIVKKALKHLLPTEGRGGSPCRLFPPTVTDVAGGGEFAGIGGGGWVRGPDLGACRPPMAARAQLCSPDCSAPSTSRPLLTPDVKTAVIQGSPLPGPSRQALCPSCPRFSSSASWHLFSVRKFSVNFFFSLFFL